MRAMTAIILAASTLVAGCGGPTELTLMVRNASEDDVTFGLLPVQGEIPEQVTFERGLGGQPSMGVWCATIDPGQALHRLSFADATEPVGMMVGAQTELLIWADVFADGTVTFGQGAEPPWGQGQGQVCG